jgi:CRP-like cAMP-binding protein
MSQLRETTPPYEDPLLHLQHKPVENFSKGRTIYDYQQPSDNLYAVVSGRVKVTLTSSDGGEAIARMVRAEGLFGESCLSGSRPYNEAAVALDDVTLMAWTSAEIEQQVERNPQLGIALSQYLVAQCIELQDRMENVAVYKIPERVMLALMRLANDLGTPTAEGTVRVPPLTHQAIAEYVGTSREIVTFHMNRMRRMGMLKYSRRHIDVYEQAITEELRRQGVMMPRVARRLVHAAS